MALIRSFLTVKQQNETKHKIYATTKIVRIQNKNQYHTRMIQWKRD